MAEAPAWARSLVLTVCAEADAPLPRLTWRHRDRPTSSGVTRQTAGVGVGGGRPRSDRPAAHPAPRARPLADARRHATGAAALATTTRPSTMLPSLSTAATACPMPPPWPASQPAIRAPWPTRGGWAFPERRKRGATGVPPCASGRGAGHRCGCWCPSMASVSSATAAGRAARSAASGSLGRTCVVCAAAPAATCSWESPESRCVPGGTNGEGSKLGWNPCADRADRPNSANRPMSSPLVPGGIAAGYARSSATAFPRCAMAGGVVGSRATWMWPTPMSA